MATAIATRTTPMESGEFRIKKHSALESKDYGTDELTDEFRITWAERIDGFGTRYVHVTKVERNETRPGKPELWLVDALSWREECRLADMVWQRLEAERNKRRPWTAEDEFDSRKHEVGV